MIDIDTLRNNERFALLKKKLIVQTCLMKFHY